jgi:hypothetical protein
MFPKAITSAPLVPPTMTLSDAVLAEIEAATRNGELCPGPRTEPRCHVCCELESKDLVNKLIAAGLTNREIAESCESINWRRHEAGDERTIGARNVWWHRRTHFNIQKPAEAAARAILERRAEEANLDYVNGIGHAVTPYAVIETLMVLGYRSMTGENAEAPSLKEMLDAAVKLHQFTNQDSNQRNMADMYDRQDRIIAAMNRVVPTEYHAAILAVLEGREVPAVTPAHVISDVLHEDAQPAIKKFVPPTKQDEHDEI